MRWPPAIGPGGRSRPVRRSLAVRVDSPRNNDEWSRSLDPWFIRASGSDSTRAHRSLRSACRRSAGRRARSPDRLRACATIQFGVDQCIRNEDWNNLFDFSDRSTSCEGRCAIEPCSDRRAVQRQHRSVAGLNTESTGQQCPGAAPSACVNRSDEVVFDRFNLDFRKFLVKGMALRIGRQHPGRRRVPVPRRKPR